MTVSPPRPEALSNHFTEVPLEVCWLMVVTAEPALLQWLGVEDFHGNFTILITFANYWIAADAADREDEDMNVTCRPTPAKEYEHKLTCDIVTERVHGSTSRPSSNLILPSRVESHLFCLNSSCDSGWGGGLKLDLTHVRKYKF